MTRISPAVAERLTDAVRARGMLRFLTHETLAKGVLNKAWTSGVGALEAWQDELRNREDDALVPMIVFAKFHFSLEGNVCSGCVCVGGVLATVGLLGLECYSQIASEQNTSIER